MMNSYKTFQYSLIFALLLAIAFTTGCAKATDACAATVCQAGGVCSDGRCSCPPGYAGSHCDSCSPGYEGSNCNTLSRDKFLSSTYAVSESKNGAATYSYAAQILVSYTDINGMYIYRIANGYFLNTVYATCLGNALTIPRQRPDLEAEYISGSGTISGSILTLSYTITDSAGQGSGSYAGIWTK